MYEDDDINQWQCELCDRRFYKEHGLKMHVLRTHGAGWNTTANLTKKKQLTEIIQGDTLQIPGERIVTVLLDRIDELQAQIARLMVVVEQQEKEKSELEDEVKKLRRPARTHISGPLTGRIQDALTTEQWQKLREGASNTSS